MKKWMMQLLPLLLVLSPTVSCMSAEDPQLGFLHSIMKLAKKGTLVNCEQLGLGSTREEIYKKWGKPKHDMTYVEKGVTFVNFNHQSPSPADQVQLVGYFGADFPTLELTDYTLPDVESALGKPILILEEKDHITYCFLAEKNVVSFYFLYHEGKHRLFTISVAQSYPPYVEKAVN